MTLCNRPTRRGGLCQMPLRGGKCPTHDVDLQKRNRAVARAFRKSNCEAFRLQRVTAGKRGFAVAAERYGVAAMSARCARWRIEHPSGPERWLIDVLASENINHYEREYTVAEYAIDFAWVERRIGIEVNGHQHRESAFGENESRAERQERKIAALEAAGWQILKVPYHAGRKKREQEAQAVIGWLKQRGIGGDGEHNSGIRDLKSEIEPEGL